jgi:hypothetical protein
MLRCNLLKINSDSRSSGAFLTKIEPDKHELTVGAPFFIVIAPLKKKLTMTGSKNEKKNFFSKNTLFLLLKHPILLL